MMSGMLDLQLETAFKSVHVLNSMTLDSGYQPAGSTGPKGAVSANINMKITTNWC